MRTNKYFSSSLGRLAVLAAVSTAALSSGAATLDPSGRPIPERGTAAPSFMTMRAAAAAGVDPFVKEHTVATEKARKPDAVASRFDIRAMAHRYRWAGVGALVVLLFGAIYARRRRKQ